MRKTNKNRLQNTWTSERLALLSRIEDLPFEIVQIETHTIAQNILDRKYRQDLEFAKLVGNDSAQAFDNEYYYDLNSTLEYMQPDPSVSKLHVAILKFHTTRISVEFLPIKPEYIIRVRDSDGKQLYLKGITNEFGNLSVPDGKVALQALMKIADLPINKMPLKPFTPSNPSRTP
jgi:hypothetical protein